MRNMMTKKEAKVLALEMARYLVDHPETTGKRHLPKLLLEKIKGLHNLCPLCETCFDKSLTCPECPLKTCGEGSLYKDWGSMKTEEERKEYYQYLLDKVSKWEPK